MFMNRMVVCVDGWPQSRRALRRVAQEATFAAPTRASSTPTLPHLGAEQALATEVITGIHREAQDLLEYEVDELGEPATGLEVSCAAAEGAPAQILLDAAGEADLLVVGSRGRGGSTALLLGSVSQQCAHLGTCSVVIVPAEPGETA